MSCSSTPPLSVLNGSSSTSKGDLSPTRDVDYPPQRHTGAVGLGPEFVKGASLDDKFNGLKQELKGKMKHDSKLVEHGRDLRTGELKRKEMRDDVGTLGQPNKSDPDEEKDRAKDAGQKQPKMEHPEDKQQ